MQTPGLFGTFGFTQACAVETLTTTSASIACRLGGFAATTSGTLWCDDVSFQLLSSAF